MFSLAKIKYVVASIKYVYLQFLLMFTKKTKMKSQLIEFTKGSDNRMSFLSSLGWESSKYN